MMMTKLQKWSTDKHYFYIFLNKLLYRAVVLLRDAILSGSLEQSYFSTTLLLSEIILILSGLPC